MNSVYIWVDGFADWLKSNTILICDLIITLFAFSVLAAILTVLAYLVLLIFSYLIVAAAVIGILSSAIVFGLIYWMFSA